MKIPRFVFFLAFSLGFLPAEEQKFSFALPEFEGRISLGVYDSSGGLLRSLFVDAKEEGFPKGLNGLIAAWDGRDDAGELVPGGTYLVRGYVVGDSVEAEGVAYHFNDWIESDDSPRISGVGAVVLVEPESFLLYGTRTKPAAGADSEDLDVLWRYDEESGLEEELTFPSRAHLLAGESGRVLVWDGVPVLYDLKRPKDPLRGPKYEPPPLWGAFGKKNLFLGPADSKGGVGEGDLETLSPGRILPAPVSFDGIDANTEALLGWKQGNGIWVHGGDDIAKVPLPEELDGFSVSAGLGASFWIAGGMGIGLGSEIVVRQHAFDGELLREMRIKEEFADEIRLFADKLRLGFYLKLASSDGSRQTLRGYRPLETQPLSTGEESVAVDWEVFFDKTLVDCRNFGWVDGRLVPDAGTSPQVNTATFAVPPDTLNAKASELVVDVASGENGLWLRGEGGLDLLRLAVRSDLTRIVLVRESSSLRVFAGDGTVVAEYLVTGLEQLAVINAGIIEIP